MLLNVTEIALNRSHVPSDVTEILMVRILDDTGHRIAFLVLFTSFSTLSHIYFKRARKILARKNFSQSFKKMDGGEACKKLTRSPPLGLPQRTQHNPSGVRPALARSPRQSFFGGENSLTTIVPAPYRRTPRCTVGNNSGPCHALHQQSCPISFLAGKPYKSVSPAPYRT